MNRRNGKLFREAQEMGLINAEVQPEVIALMYVACLKAIFDPSNRLQYSYSVKTAANDIVNVFLEGLSPR